VSDSWNRANPYWWQIPIDTNVGLLANDPLRDVPWGRGSGMVAQTPSAPQNPSISPDGGLFPILSSSRNQGAALSPFQANGGLFGSRGWAVGDAPHAPAGANVGSLARTDQPSDQLWESVSIPLAQAQFPFEGGSEPVPTARKSVDAAECNAMHERDLFHCRMVGLPACYAQANLRYANCLAGRQIPPLNY